MTLVPFYLAATWQRPELSWTALGGWLGTLADPGGPRATRAKVLVAFAVLGAAAIAPAEGAASWPLLATAGLVLAAFALSLVRALGGAAGSLGTFVTVVVAIASARTSEQPVRDALAFGAGTALALFVSTIAWPVWTHLPVRRSVARVYTELANYMDAAARAATTSPERGAAAFTAVVREHHRRIRAAIEAARESTLQARARRQGETRFGGDVRAALGNGEAQFRLVAALVFELESLEPGVRRPLATRLGRFAESCRVVARTLVARVVRAPAHEPPSSLRVARKGGESVAFDLADRLARAGDIALEAALGLGRGDVRSVPRAKSVPPSPVSFGKVSRIPARGLPLRVRETAFASLQTLRDAGAPGSPFLHHALRTALAVGLSSLLAAWLSPVRGYWVTLTTLAVLQPYPGATVKRASERVVGTVLGSVLAVAIVEAVRSPLALSALLVPLSIAAVATRPRSYRLFTFFLTPVFVLLAGRASGDLWTAALRAGDAVLGGAVALAVGALIAPASEARHLPELIAPMLEALREYAEETLRPSAERFAPSFEDRLIAARRASGIRLGDAETSLERFLAEPLRDRRLAARWVLLLTYSRRLAASLTAIDAVASGSALQGSESGIGATARYLGRVLAPLCAREPFAVSLERPPEPEDDAPLSRALERAVRWGELVASVRSEEPSSGDLSDEGRQL